MYASGIIAGSRAIKKISHIDIFLDAHIAYYKKLDCTFTYSHVIAWGRKKSTLLASLIAKKHNLPLLYLEDGFLRSIDLGKKDPPLSIVVDSLGIYYDATCSSTLEQLIQLDLTPFEIKRAQFLISLWREQRVSKYNFSRDYLGVLPKPYVLVVDQTYGDLSIQFGLSDISCFQLMLDSALAENPNCSVLIKIHPDVVAGYKRGHFNFDLLKTNPRIVIFSESVHPVRLIEESVAVYCVTSQIGFEALLWGKKVRTFGMPFYAGWGLTIDDLSAPTRRTRVSLENLVYASLIAYSRYIDPETLLRCEAERLIEWLGFQRLMRERFPSNITAIGFSRYKKPIVKRFFQGSIVQFTNKLKTVPKDTTIVLWGNKRVPVNSQWCNFKIIRLEDGFIRSVGLGVDLILPFSWAIDSVGIYYNAHQVSDLENLLNTTQVSIDLLSRATSLRNRLVNEGLCKYNIGVRYLLSNNNNLNFNKKIILVPGQVESDASLALGAVVVNGNIELLKRVRTENPDAFLIYKPHPDVVAGLRSKGINENSAGQFCDLQIFDANIADLLTQVDEVHTMTSLTGFEALLRGKKVVCYGLPFYAGWGLTEDKVMSHRRTRNLTIDELIASALILYPTYISHTTGKFTTPERVLDEIALLQQKKSNHLPWWRLLLRTYLKFELYMIRFISNFN